MVIIYTSFEIESSSLNMTLLIEKVKTRNNPGLVVMGRDSHYEGRGFESRRHILDGQDIFYIDLL